MGSVRVDAGGQPLELRHLDWSKLFSPRTAVVVGATDTEGSPQRAQWTQIRDRLGARGAEVIPVHPSKAEVLGTPAYASVAAVPGPIDLAVILVRDPFPALEECRDRGVSFAIVFTAGFGEVGTAEGDAGEARLAALASGAMRVIGPNTNMNILEPWQDGLPGKKLGIITQSGYQGRPIAQGQVLGIPIEAWATVGNEVDVEWADLVAYFAGLDRVGAIATYVEGFKSGRTFMLAADIAARARIPIVCVKVGRSDEGRKMAQAHTGHLTGSDTVHDAVFEQYGVIRVDDIDEVIELSGMFCHTEPVAGPGRVGVYAMSGGTASHVADLCGTHGVPVPKFEQATIDAVAAIVPWYLHIGNPLDSGGALAMRPENRTVLELMLDDPNVDILFAPITGVFPGMSDALAKDLIELHHAQSKPVITCWTSPIHDDPAYRALCDAGVPLFHSFGAAVRGLAELGRYGTFTRSYRSPFEDMARERAPGAARARALLRAGAALDEVAAKTLLSQYGIPTVREHVVRSPAEAATAAADLGFPVVMKILSAEILHKSDLGLVTVGVASARDAENTYRDLVDRAAASAPSGATDQVVVQPMVRGAVAEAILGVSHQPPFGATVMYGLGGIFTEVFQDVSFGVPPFGERHARAMIERTRGAALLRGARGRPRGDIDALVDAIVALQRLALELGDDIVELDVNPLMVLPEGHGVVAVDALVIAR